MKELATDMSTLLFHLKSCPGDFLKTSSINKGGIVNTNALLQDVYRKIFGDVTVEDKFLPYMKPDDRLDTNHIMAIQIGCWLFSHSSFLRDNSKLLGIQRFLFGELSEVAPYVKYTEWVSDEDRTEEFIRLALKSCELLLKGETVEEAADRLDALSTLKRRNVLQESNAAMQRIKELRQKMADAKAREAANVYGRE
jgi:hypothetical protein